MSNLIDEIREARKVLRQREAEASDAGYVLKMAKATRDKAQAALDELLDELESGQSKYPLYERLRPNGEPMELPVTPDEHQRGPTEFPASTIALNPLQGRPAGVTTPAPAPPGKAARAKRQSK
jgi:hypothetical protein